MAKFIKKLFTLALSLALVLVLIPVTNVVRADSELSAEELNQLNAAQSNFGISFKAKIDNNEYSDLATFFYYYQQATEATVTLESDLVLCDNGAYIPVLNGQNITLDFNGHKIYKEFANYSWTGYPVKVLAGGTLTITDSVGNGGIASKNACIEINEGGTLYGNGGNLSNTANVDTGDWAYSIISRGTVVVPSTSTLVVNGVHGALAIDGGSATVAGGSFIASDYYGLFVSNNISAATVNVTGGTFNGGTSSNNKSVLVAKENQSNEDSTLTITGGTFNYDPTAYVADGYKVEENSGLYTVSAVNYVAQIGVAKYESFDEAVAAAQAGDTIVLLDNITFGTDRSVPVWGGSGEQPFNINLNGHTFQTDSEVSIDAGNNGYKASAFCFAFDNEANITVSGGDIKTAFGAGVYVSGENVNLTLEDVDIAQNYPQNVQTTNEYSSAVRITYEGSVEINGGTYGGKNSIAVSNTGGTVVINDGTFYNDIYFSNYTSKSYYDGSRDAVKSITINGGTFLGNFVNPNKGNLVIKGGSFTSDPTAYVAEGYKVTEASGVYTVSAVNYVAQIGETQYETLADAINVANADTSSNAITIKLLADLDFSDDEYKAYKWSGSNVNPLAITRSNVTLDLNGKTISNMGNCALGVGSIYAKDGTIANVTIKNGTLLAGKTDNVTNSYVLLIGGTNNCLIDSVTTLGGVNNCNNSNVVIKDSTIRGTKYYTVCAQTGANVTIRGTSYTKNTDQTVQTKAMFWVQGAGTDEDLITSSNPTGAFNASIITIESGYFNVDSNGAFYLGGGLAPTLTGGYYNIDPAAYVADGYAVESVSEEYEGVTYTYHVTTKKVAQIGNEKYESLAAAVAAANGGDTIVLINDATESNYFFVQKNITIDLNGYTASLTGSYGIIVHNGQLTIDDSGVDGKLTCSGSRTIQVQGATGELTVNGGTIENTKQAGLAVNISNTGKSVVINDGSIIAGTNGYGVQANGTSTITINGGTITSGGWGVTSFDTATITVNDGTITATKYSISANGSSGNNATIIINGGYIGNEENDAGIYVPSGSLTVIDGEIVGENGIYFKSTNLDIRGGIVRGVGNYQEYSYNANGSNPTGDALVIDSCGYPNGIDNVSISGGHFVSANASPVKVYIYQENEPVEKFITGGTYASVSPDAEYIADGYKAVEENDIYSVVPITYVAQIGDVQYETLADAIAAVADNTQTTIKMIADENVEGNAGVIIPNTKNIVLDLNGKTIQNLVNENKGSQVITNRGTLTITDTSANADGVIRNNVADGTVAGNWYSTPQANYVTNVITNYGTLVIEGGTIQQTSNGYIAFAVDNVTNANLHTPTTTINGGTLKSEMTTVRLFCNSSTNLNSVTMTGGTVESKRHAFYLQNPSAKTNMGLLTISDGNVSSTLNYLQIDAGADSSKLDASITGGNFVGALSVDGTYKGFISGGKFAVEPNSDYIVEGYAALTNTDEDSATYPYIVGEEVNYVAKIGETKYETLAAAVAAATDGDTIVLIDNLTISSYVMVKKDITLDLNGHTIEVNGGTYGLISSRYNLVITDSSTNGDGKIYSTAKEAVLVQNGGSLTVNGGTIEAAYDGDGYAIYVLSGSANVNAGNIVAGSGDTCIYARNASEVEINGGTVTSASWGIVMINTSILTVNGGTVTGNTYAISTNGTSGQNAQIIITSGTIGNENSGAGIYLPSGSLDVSGGTITGKTGIYFKSTNLNITGGEIVGVGPAVEYNYSGNGSNSTGDALVIDSCGYPNGIDDVNVSGGHFVSANAAAVKVYTYQENEPVEKFITGGIYNTLPDAEYVAEGYKAVYYEGNYQVGPVSYEAETGGSIEGTTVPETITYNVNKVVKEDETASAETMASETSFSVEVSANAVENDTKAVASLGNIKDDATLKAIVEKAVEAAGSAIDANTISATIEITVAKGAADVVNNKATYEVHPEALIKVDGVEVASVEIENEDLNGTFTFKLYAGNITQSGKYVKVTHIHSDNTSEDLGELLVDAEGYVTVTGVESFSDFTLEVVETEVSAYAKFGYTISLEESINIVFNVKDLTDDLNTYTVEYVDPSTGEIVEKVPTNATLNSYVIAKCAAKQMGDVFTVVVKHNGTQINQTTDFSIKNYCDTIINGNFSTYIKDLCKATLDYGRYAQEAFDYYGSGLVNDGNDYFDNSAIDVPDYAGQVVSNTFDGELNVSFSLTTESQTILNIYLTGVEANNYSVLVNGEETMFRSLGPDKIQVSITGIKAKDLGEKITIQVNDAGSMHELVYKVSPVDYMGFAIGHNSQVLINRAFYNYYLKAVDYFNNK